MANGYIQRYALTNFLFVFFGALRFSCFSKADSRFPLQFLISLSLLEGFSFQSGLDNYVRAYFLNHLLAKGVFSSFKSNGLASKLKTNIIIYFNAFKFVIR